MAFKTDEILENFEESKRIPSTHRHGFPGKRDDVAEGRTGENVFVPTPETPDDPFPK
jgi:hypothetical protein